MAEQRSARGEEQESNRPASAEATAVTAEEAMATDAGGTDAATPEAPVTLSEATQQQAYAPTEPSGLREQDVEEPDGP